jgi:DNA-binding IclR family transcriptional regulator
MVTVWNNIPHGTMLRSMTVVNPLVERVLDVLGALAEGGRSRRLSDVADQVRLSKSVTHRLLQSLCARGWVEQERETGFYRLTLRLPLIAQRYLSATRLPDLVQPIVERLARDSRESARVAAAIGDGLAWLATAQGATSSLVMQAGTGKLPLHATANGKAWLATLGSEKASRVVLAQGFGDPTDLGPNAILSIDDLLNELAAIRARGHAFNFEESEIGVVTVAAAVMPHGPSAPAVATVSVSGPSVRFSRERADEIGRTLIRDAAQELAELWPLPAAGVDAPQLPRIA